MRRRRLSLLRCTEVLNPKPEKNTESKNLTEENIPINDGVNLIKHDLKTNP